METLKTAPATMLDETCVITGRLDAGEDVRVEGHVDGDVSATGRLEIFGSIRGDVACGSFDLCTGALEGGLSCKGADGGRQPYPGRCARKQLEAVRLA